MYCLAAGAAAALMLGLAQRAGGAVFYNFIAAETGESIGFIAFSEGVASYTEGWSVHLPPPASPDLQTFQFDFLLLGAPPYGLADCTSWFTPLGPVGSLSGPLLDFGTVDLLSEHLYFQIELVMSDAPGMDRVFLTIDSEMLGSISGDWVEGIPAPGGALLLVLGISMGMFRSRR